MAEGTLLVSCFCPHLCPQSNSAQQPEPAYENVSRTRSLPCPHSPLAPPHSESRPEPYREHCGPRPKVLLPRCPPRSLPHLPPGSPPPFRKSALPPAQLHCLFSPQPYHPLIYLLISSCCAPCVRAEISVGFVH